VIARRLDVRYYHYIGAAAAIAAKACGGTFSGYWRSELLYIDG
jgi:hypothetical protein